MISQHRVNDFRVLVQVSGGCFKPTACKFLPFYLSFHYLLYWTCRNIHMDWKWRNGMGFGRFLLMQIKEIHIQKCERLCTGIRMLQSKVYFKMEKTFAKTALSHNKLTVWRLTTHIWVVPHPYMGRTAPLTSKRCILYIYSTHIGTEHFKHALYCLFFLFKMQSVS